MITVPKELADSLTSNVQSEEEVKEEEEEEEEQVYAVDLSGVPRKFVDMGDGDGFYRYPRNDVQLLKCCRTTGSGWNYFDGFYQPELYEVKVEAGNCTVKRCLELLKGVGRENRFIACSVERANLFFAELNKEDADKLRGLDGIRSVFPRADRMFHVELCM